MTKRFSLFLLAGAAALLCATRAKADHLPLRLHPQNGHYFLFRGKPTLLVTSGEHYGAVINLDFDYRTYLKTLHADGLNLTRVFTGAYREPNWGPADQNPLAPRAGKFLAPWARSRRPGYHGGNKFDLDRWDEAYFRRLRDFVAAAERYGIVVEVVFFSQMYDDRTWRLSPLHPDNNVQGVGRIGSWERFTTLDSPQLVARQEALIRKVIAELKGFDNVYFELCNEPNLPMDPSRDQGPVKRWLNHLAAVTAKVLAAHSARHLIAAQDPSRCDSAAVLVDNYHYAYGDNWVGAMQGLERYYGRNRPQVFDETETERPEQVSRREAWAFLLSGGAGYNHLDVSFMTDDASGSGRAEWDGKRHDYRELRRQLGFLKRFLERFPFVRMRPAPDLLAALPQGAKAYLLAEESKAYALYVPAGDGSDLALRVPAGRYRAEWWNPVAGTLIQSAQRTHPGGDLRLTLPAGHNEIALRLVVAAASR